MRRLKTALDVTTTVVLLVAAGVFLWRNTVGPPVPPEVVPPVAVEEFDGQMSLSGLSPHYMAGSRDAALVLVEFSDLECPFCARHAKNTYPAIEKEWIEPGAVRYVFRHFPLQQSHQFAVDAAKAAHCSAGQEKFWEARSALFEAQAEFGKQEWGTILASVSIDPSLHADCLESTDDGIILADVVEGERLGVNSTPTFFVGVEQDDGSVQLLLKIRGSQPYEVFKTSLERAMSMISEQDFR